MRKGLAGQRLVAVFLAGMLLLNYPILSLFDRPASLFGLPLLHVYLFSVWLGLIVAATRVPAAPAEDRSNSPPNTLGDRERLCVKPGLTCSWQVSGRSDIPFDRQVLLDVDYIHQRSLWTDIKLLFKTIPAVLLGRGAY